MLGAIAWALETAIAIAAGYCLSAIVFGAIS